MKRSKKMILLLCVLAVVCVAAIVMTQYDPEQEQVSASNEVILSLSSGSVQKLSWQLEDTALAFHRGDKNTWLYDEDADFPVNQEGISTLLAEFQELTANFVIDDVTDYSQYGLEEPLCTVLLSTDTQNYIVKLGAYSEIDSLRYVSLEDGKVYLISTDPLTAFETTLDDLFLHDSLPTFETVSKISFAGLGLSDITYTEEGGASYSPDDVWFMDGLPLDTALVESYISTVSDISLADCVSYNASDETLSDWGLDIPNLSITVHYATEESDGSTVHRIAQVHLGVVTLPLLIGDDTENTHYYLRLDDSRLIYQITETQYNRLCAVSYNDLRHTAVLTADFSTATALDITLAENTYTFSSTLEVDEETETETIVWSYGDTKISISSVKSALTALTASDFTTEVPTGQEEIRIVLHLTNDYADTMEIALFRVDGSTCLCQVNGEAVCYISRNSAVNLIEAVNAIILN